MKAFVDFFKTTTLRNILFLIPFSLFLCAGARAASVVATIGGNPITDADITARTKLMARQGDTATDSRRKALGNIIDDQVKLDYAANFKAVPSDADVAKQLKVMKLDDLTATETAMARRAISADMAWQIVIGRTIVPTIDVTDEDVAAEKRNLEHDKGLPIEMTIVRLIDIPENVAAQLTKPKDCDDAMAMARNLGGDPHQFTAAQYELSEDIRARVTGLPVLTWSGRQDNSVLLVCGTKNMPDYGKLNEIIKRNTIYKKALFIADQQLKQLRRKAVVIVNDERYKSAIN